MHSQRAMGVNPLYLKNEATYRRAECQYQVQLSPNVNPIARLLAADQLKRPLTSYRRRKVSRLIDRGFSVKLYRLKSAAHKIHR